MQQIRDIFAHRSPTSPATVADVIQAAATLARHVFGGVAQAPVVSTPAIIPLDATTGERIAQLEAQVAALLALKSSLPARTRLAKEAKAAAASK